MIGLKLSLEFGLSREMCKSDIHQLIHHKRQYFYPLASNFIHTLSELFCASIKIHIQMIVREVKVPVLRIGIFWLQHNGNKLLQIILCFVAFPFLAHSLTFHWIKCTQIAAFSGWMEIIRERINAIFTAINSTQTPKRWCFCCGCLF